MKHKYKVWDKKLNVMWPGIELERLLRYLMFQPYPNADAYMALKDHFSETVWLQFTGLLDSKGKEIYEDDILRIWWSDDEEDFTDNLVSWDEKYSCWRYGNNPMGELADPPLYRHEVFSHRYEMLGTFQTPNTTSRTRLGG